MAENPMEEAMRLSGMIASADNQAGTPPATPAPAPTPEPVITPIPAATPATPATDPAATPATPEPTAQKPFEELFFEKTGFKTVEELNAIRSEHSTLKAETEALKNKKYYANESIQKLNDFVEKGGDARVYMQAMNIDLEKLSPEAKIAQRLQLENGLTPAEAEGRVARKYKLGNNPATQQPWDESDPDVMDARIDLKMDSQAAHKVLAETIAKSTTPPPSFNSDAARVQWAPIVPKAIDDAKNFNWKWENPDKTISELSFKIDENNHEHKAALVAATNLVNDIIGQEQYQDLDINERSQFIKDTVQTAMVVKLLPSILREQKRLYDLAAALKTNNPTGTGGAPPSGKDAPPFDWEGLGKKMRPGY